MVRIAFAFRPVLLAARHIDCEIKSHGGNTRLYQRQNPCIVPLRDGGSAWWLRAADDRAAITHFEEPVG